MTKNICIIPARGGSKRIPKKNIKEFCGKPLIAYSIETALQSELFDKVLVSTDSEEIAEVAKRYGADVQMRPPELADDFTGTWDVIEYVLSTLEEQYDYVCTLYATAPLLEVKYLKEGYEKLKNSDACRSFSVTSMPFPIQRTFKITDEGRCRMFWPENYSKRSQDLEEAYQDAGQFYWEKIGYKSEDVFFGKDSIPIVLPRHLVQDIDTMEDFERAELMFRALHKNIFDKWNTLKQRLNSRKHNFYIKQGEIYFLSIGQNIGYEIYGKDEMFLRPVLVFKKLNRYTFIGIPLTTKEKEGDYYFSFQYKKNKNSTAQIAQMRMFDIKRIEYRSGKISREDFDKLKKKVAKLFGLDITPQTEGKLHSKDLEQRINRDMISKKD